MGVEIPVLVGLAVVAFLAGFVDAIAGGGGLLQLPALAAALGGWTPHAFAVNKVASACGTSAAVVRYARHGSVRWDHVLLAGPLALVCSMGGAWLLTRYARSAKDALEVVFSACFLALAGHQAWLARRGAGAGRTAHRWPRLTVAGVAVIGAYDGFVGPGTGMLLFWVFTTWAALPPLESTGTTKAVNWLTNVGALATFVPRGEVLWPLAGTLASANLVGGWLGAHAAIRRGVGFIRVLTAVVSAGATVYLLLR